MAALLTSCSIDGIDWDLEQDLTPANASALAGLVDWGTSQSFLVTADPYYAQSEFWNAAQQQSQQGFAWWNVQMYASQTNIDEYPQWVEGVIGDRLRSAILSSCRATASRLANGDPGSITGMLQADRSNAPGLDGAMLWKYEFIVSEGKGTLQAYVQAIQAGRWVPPPRLGDVPRRCR